ncbi:MAG: hypothetical protein AAF985_27240, partial [Bacteroidota bacterium]
MLKQYSCNYYNLRQNALMKNLLLLLCILMSRSALSQEDTTTLSHTQEIGFFEEQQFINAHDFALQTYTETQSLLKLDLTGVILRLPTFSSTVKYNIRQDWRLDYERKIGQAFSINTQLQLGYALFDEPEGSNVIGRNRISGGLSLQGRWYYNMKRRIKAGQTANNLSGNYLAFRLGHRYALGQRRYRLNSPSLGLQFGIQRRIFGRGFIDVQFGPQLVWNKTTYQRENGATRIFDIKTMGFSSSVRLGIAIGEDKLDWDAAQRCDVFRCFSEKRQLLKIDLLQSFRFTLGSFQSRN